MPSLASHPQAEMGDARRLLDVCKAALQASFPAGVVTASSCVTLPCMSTVLRQFFRSSQASRVEELPRLAQVLLACLCGMVEEVEAQEKKKKGVTPAQLKEVYVQVHKTVVGGTRPNLVEFNQLMDQLTHNGICKIADAKRMKPADRPVSAGRKGDG